MYIRLMNNGAKGVLEPFYDGGEAYRDYHKYVTLNNYKVEPEGAAYQTWATANFKVLPHSVTSAERKCDIDLGRFDEIYIETKIPGYIEMRLLINGEEIIRENGAGDTRDYSGRPRNRRIKSIRMEFKNSSDSVYDVSVGYIGVRDSCFLSESDIKGENTIPDWEGCFEENPKIELYTNFFVDDADKLREKMKSRFFAKTYAKTKEEIMGFMDMRPEELISETIGQNMYYFYAGAAGLAFVGFIERNVEMLRAAARFALSAASCDTWYISDKETAEGITWNNRVFSQTYLSYGISIFMEFGGSVLTWHGRNYLYEALVRKGISMLDGDFKRMEYIYHMNQGLAFSPGYIYSLVTLTDRFPRYKKRIDEIEADVNEMVSGCINEDGGMMEGLGYLGYTIESYCLTACLLARYRGMSIREYIGGRLDKTSDFALTLTGEKNIFRTVGDTGRGSFGKHICMFMYQATGNSMWKRYHDEEIKKYPDGQAVGAWYFGYLLFGEDISLQDAEQEEEKEKFCTFPDSGYTYLRRDGVEFFSISGKSFSHCHPDKGSFTIDLNNEPVLIDRGMVSYNEACANELSASEAHNMALPVVDGVISGQNSQHGYGSTMRSSRYENGVLEWISDNDNVWDRELIIKNVRTIISENPYEYEIIDEFEFTRPAQVAFLLNMYSDEHIKVEPKNWKPVETKYEPFSVDYAKKSVMRLKLLSEECVKCKLITKINVIE